MSEILAEVDQIMRQERIEKLWKDNAPYILTFIIATILLTAAYSGYTAWNTSVKEKQTALMVELQQAENYPENLLTLEKLDMRPALRGIQYLNGAGVFMQTNKTAEALTLYMKIAQDQKIPADIRALGVLMASRIGGSDKEKAQELISLLKPIAGSTSNPWSAHAHLEIAVLIAHHEQNFEKARAHLNEISNTQGLPDSMYNRARALEKLYTAQATSKKTNDE